MRGLGAMAAATPAEHDPALPGVRAEDRARMNAEARAELASALAEGRSLRELVLHVEPDQATVVDRRALVLLLRSCGAFSIARKLERDVPPVGCVTLYIDTDGATEVTSVPLWRLGLQEGAPASTVAAQSPKGGA